MGIAFIEGHSQDAFFQDLINDLDRHDQRIQLLLAAERQMDEAAIFTIHGFCQRMLKQHAFESRTLFSSELLTDESHLLNDSVADFWRRTLYPLDKPLTALARSLWSSPESLLAAIRPWLNRSHLHINSGKLPDTFKAFDKNYVEPVLAIKLMWLEDAVAVEEELRSCGLKANCKSINRLDKMDAFIHGPELHPNLDPKDKKGWELYSTNTLQSSLKKNGTLPQHPVFKKIDELLNNSLSLKDAFQGMMLKQALQSVKKQLIQLKSIRHQLSFDDLLANLSSALTRSHGIALAEAIRSQYRVAMIDEFQDTDPQQYQIFTQVYADHEDNLTGLFLIGDPKQAIYAFRGADIFTYMEARRHVSAHYTLDTNWRSSTSMIKAVNTLFSQSSSPFIYNDDIPFHPVQVSEPGKHKTLTVNDEILPAIHIWLQQGHSNSTIGSKSYQDVMSLATAIEVNKLLTLSNQKQCLIKKGKQSKQLQASDIAILVRTGHQGHLIRNSLAQQGIASVYLSSNDSVFSSQEALDVKRLLSACLTPTNERALRSALATPLLGLDALYLESLNHDEQAWEQTVNEFSHYQHVWFEQGVLPMLRHVIYQRHIAENLLVNEFGERQLTDLLHLGQLLANQELELNSYHALYRWLNDAIGRPNEAAAEQQLHLESERNLVKIVTIHKSKGLEYNVVFLPFICSWREANQPIYHDVNDNKTVLDLEGQKQSMVFADKERLAEDLRLLYVALTRSVHRCYLVPVRKPTKIIWPY